MKFLRVSLLVFLILFFFSRASCREIPFTQEDRDRLIKIETKVEVGFAQIDKRFAQIDKRFEDFNKRFEQINKRFEDFNKRFEQIDKRFEQIDKRFAQIDKRFEDLDKRFVQIDKRFEDFNKRFGELITFMWMLVVIFMGITGVTISFALWDRRTMIRPFEEKVREIEEGKIKKIIYVLNELAKTDKRVADLLRELNL